MHHLGHTRSANGRDHLFLTPDTFVRTPLPGLMDGWVIVHASPQTGAGFTMMSIEFAAGGVLTAGPAQRFLYVLEGELTLAEQHSLIPHKLVPGSFAYLPSSYGHTLNASTKARVVVIEKSFQPLHEEHTKLLANRNENVHPYFLVGQEHTISPVALNGDPDLQVRSLLPSSLAFDFACNTMTYQPGAALSQVEVHYMEHGLLMLEGGGIYRLGDQWYPTQANDFIWMGPYCPQWFGALGKQPAKYLIYKDFNRHTLSSVGLNTL